MLRKLLSASTLVVLALAAWIAVGPFLAAREIRTAVIRNDEASLDRRIDFPAVRESLKGQLYGLVDDSGPPQAGSGSFGDALKSLMGGAVDVFLTPRGVLELLRRKTALAQNSGDGDSSPAPADSGSSRRKPVIHYRFASPNRFEVEVADADYPEAPAKLVLLRYGLDWKLAAIELPLHGQSAPAP